VHNERDEINDSRLQEAPESGRDRFAENKRAAPSGAHQELVHDAEVAFPNHCDAVEDCAEQHALGEYPRGDERDVANLSGVNAAGMGGTFYFSGGANSTASNSGANNAAPSETRFDAAAFEYSYWETIKNSTSADEFKAYLSRYPEGQFAALAKVKIKNLEVATKPAEPEPTSRNSGGTEIAFWDSVKNSTNPEDFQAYLKKYPNGDFAELANNRLRALETERGKTEAIKKSSLEGTTWMGDSPGGDKHYKFQFLPNGELVWHLKMGPFDDVYKGTWRQTGNSIYMEVRKLKTPEMEATISGDKITGSWGGDGSYKFTLEKAP